MEEQMPNRCLVKAYAIYFLFSGNACPSERCICWCQVKICVKGFCHDKTHYKVRLGRPVLDNRKVVTHFNNIIR